jgi:hypothetical protein
LDDRVRKIYVLEAMVCEVSRKDIGFQHANGRAGRSKQHKRCKASEIFSLLFSVSSKDLGVTRK